MGALPSSGCLTKLRDLLQTKRSEGCYLLSVHSANWPVKSNTGLEAHRGKSMDSSRIWFIRFLSSLETMCRSLQGTEMSAIAEDINETISDLRLKKLEGFDPSMEVFLPKKMQLCFQ